MSRTIFSLVQYLGDCWLYRISGRFVRDLVFFYFNIAAFKNHSKNNSCDVFTFCSWVKPSILILQKRWKSIQYHCSPVTAALFSFAVSFSDCYNSSCTRAGKPNYWTIVNPVSTCSDGKPQQEIKQCHLDCCCRIVNSCTPFSARMPFPITLLQKKAIGRRNREETPSLCIRQLS